MTIVLIAYLNLEWTLFRFKFADPLTTSFFLDYFVGNQNKSESPYKLIG